MQDYSSLNSDLILKKTNSIIGQKITDFPQYKSALPKDFKYPRNDLPNIQAKEWFDNKKLKKDIFKSVKTTTISAANSLGYLFIPGLRFKSISQGITDHMILSKNLSPAQTVSQLLTQTKGTTDGLDKTIAIMYTGSGSTTIQRKCYFMRQFWLEDIELLPDNLQTGNKDGGIFFRKLSDVNEIISSPENLSKYEWINDGRLDNYRTKLDNTNYNLFDTIYFLMCFNEQGTWKDPNPDFFANLEIKIKKIDASPDNINKSSLFRLVKIDTDKNNDRFYIQHYNTVASKWYGTRFEDISQSTPVFKTNGSVTDKGVDWILKYDSVNKRFYFYDPTGWEHGGSLRRANDKGGRITFRNFGVLDEEHMYKVIHPNYKYIYSKLFSDPMYGAQSYICMYGTPTGDTEMIQFSKDNNLYPPFSTEQVLTSNCEVILQSQCSATTDGTTYPYLFTDECSTYCKKSLVGGCDIAFTEWCKKNKPDNTIDVNSDVYNDYVKKCGCFMPDNYYNNVSRSYSEKGISLPNCVRRFKYDLCGNADYKDQESVLASDDSCNVDVTNCVQNVKFDNQGRIVGNVTISQDSKCTRIRSPTTPPATTPPATTPPATTPPTTTPPATTPPATTPPATTPPATTPPTTTPPTTTPPATTPIVPPKINPPPPPADDKIMGLEKNVFYGVSAGAVILLLIIIGFAVSRR